MTQREEIKILRHWINQALRRYKKPTTGHRDLVMMQDLSEGLKTISQMKRRKIRTWKSYLRRQYS